jgi:hypothetical protein
MKKQRYNFKIIFEKLEEARKEQSHISDSDLTVSKDINEQIRKLKEFYDDSAQELETYTRSN